MANVIYVLTQRIHALELELREVKREGALRERHWERDFGDLFQMNQRQLDFVDAALVQMSQSTREREQLEHKVNALQAELRRTIEERQQSEQNVHDLQEKLRKMEIDCKEMQLGMDEVLRFNLLLRENLTE